MLGRGRFAEGQDRSKDPGVRMFAANGMGVKSYGQKIAKFRGILMSEDMERG